MTAAIFEMAFLDFGNQATWVLWLFSAGAIVLLSLGADRVVAAAVRLASASGMSTVIIGATVVSLGTTSPEAVTSVTAALQGEPGLALGNGVGSIICDTALIFGLVCLIGRPLRDRFVLRRQGAMKVVFEALLIVTLGGLVIARGSIEAVVLPRVAGICFVALLGVYMYLSVRWAGKHPASTPIRAKSPSACAHRLRASLVNLLVLVVGLGFVIAGSRILIGSVCALSIRYGVPTDVLAVTVVAFGTSLPELVTAIAAVLKGHGQLAVGNIIGADILNVLFVIGISATAVPLKVPATFFYLHLPVMAAASILMAAYLFMTRAGRFHRWQGLPLLALYAGYYVLLLTIMPRT
ncbi:MAG: sodium:calcium antiporter [Planctomycetota bacterium]|nr:sodium:calcium antiporter [Planctomycetota bacterium]